jgi:NTP-dependent ternary system trypsin peptidase co-occuring protein
MSEAVRFTLSDGTAVLVAPAARAGVGPVGLGSRVEDAQRSLLAALEPVTSAASEVIEGFRTLARRPDEIEVTFGVVLDAKLGGVLASTSAGTHLDVTLRWHASPPDADPEHG